MPELLPENPFWPSPRADSFEHQTCVGPFGEYSAAFPGAGAGGMGAGRAPGVGAIVGVGAGSAAARSNRRRSRSWEPELMRNRRWEPVHSRTSARRNTHGGGDAAHDNQQWPALAKGAIAMQIAPTIRLIDTRFDMLIFSNSQKTVRKGCSTDSYVFLPAMPMATSRPDVGRKPARWSRSTLQDRYTIGPASLANWNDCLVSRRAVARRAAHEWFVG